MKIRNVFSMFMLAAAMLFVVGCADSPSKVVEKWSEAIIDGDVEEANEYCTAMDKTQINAFNSEGIAVIAENLEFEVQFRKRIEEALYEGERIYGDRAEVGLEYDPLYLKKVDGEWKIDVSKLDR